MTPFTARLDLYNAIHRAMAIRDYRGEHSPEYAAAKAKTDAARETYAAICNAMFKPGDVLTNRRYPSDVRTVTRVEGEYVYTGAPGGTESGVMGASFYEENFDRAELKAGAA